MKETKRLISLYVPTSGQIHVVVIVHVHVFPKPVDRESM